MSKSAKKSAKNICLKAFFTSLICSLAFFSVLLALFVKARNDDSLDFGIFTPHSAVTSSHMPTQNRALAPEESFEDYIRDTVFIGDSRTNGFLSYHCLSEDHVLAKDGENHQSARTDRLVHTNSGDITIAQAIARAKPYRMIVSFGINGIAFMNESTFMQEYSALLDELHAASPQSILFVQSIWPVSESRESADSRYANSLIDRYNGLLKSMTEKKGFRYLDSSSVLKDGNNCLASRYDSGDGLHFNSAAYEALMNFYKANYRQF